MSDRPLHNLLLARLAGTGDAILPPAAISRRAFLGSVGAAGAVTGLSIADAYGDPRVRLQNNVLLVQYRGRSWRLDARAFGPRAHFGLQRGADSFRIRLNRGRFLGTSLPVALDVRIFPLGAAWRIAVSLTSLGFAAQHDLARWLAGEPIEQRKARSIDCRAGRGRLKAWARKIEISAAQGLTVKLGGRAELSGAVDCSAGGISFATDLAGVSDGISPPGWRTAFAMPSPRVRARGYASGTRTRLAVAKPFDTERFGGYFFEVDAAFSQAAIFEGPAQLELRTRGAHDAALTFSHAAVSVGSVEIGIAGHFNPEAMAVSAGACLALVRGDGGAPFCGSFRVGEIPRFSASMLAEALMVPIGGGTASIELPAVPVELATEKPHINRIIVGQQPSVQTKLDNGRLTLRSPANLLHLVFHIVRGFSYSTDRGGPYLVREKKGGGYEPALIVVEFPPQHLGETILDIVGSKDGALCFEQPGNPGSPCPPGQSSRSDYSAPSRVAFLFDEKPGEKALWTRKRISVEELTDWTGLTMAVPERAKADIDDNDYKTQITKSGIFGGDGLDAVVAKIGATLGPPGPHETSLELARALIFSPAENAVWEREALGSPERAPLFGMRLGRGRNPRLRAIASRRLPAGRIPSNVDLKDATCDPFSPLSATDHWEIVGQTSVYGLPALRRGTRVDETKSPDAQGGADAAIAKVPRGGVVRPTAERFQYLIEVDERHAGVKPGTPDVPPEIGIALATSFETADITLTSLGATMRLDWAGEPAILKPAASAYPKMPSSFSLERLSYQTWLGRDVRVIAVKKGYLFPLGIRASYVTLAERVFLPGADGRPVAKEVIRRFITTPSTPKTYPAVNQPFDGRDFPAARLVMQTRRTPDLIDPTSDEGGSLATDELSRRDAWAFWPHVRGTDGRAADFDWKIEVDGDPAPLTVNLIFVLNAAAAEPTFVEALVTQYNAELAARGGPRRPQWPARYVARLGGARRTYAQPLETGLAMPGRGATDVPPPPDTAFDTDSWLLGVRGRVGTDGRENYVMDARMNGADQPPFYPVVRKAAIAVQSIDRLVGRPQGLLEAQFYAPYVRSAFSDSANAGGVFLEVIHPQIALDPAAEKKPATGGVAQPATYAAALSRKIGVVGSKKINARKTLVGGREPAKFDFSAVERGEFDPSEFLELKIFGINLLDAVMPSDGKKFGLDRAPRLTELVQYGANNTNLGPIGDAAAALGAEIGVIRARINAAIKAFDQNPEVSGAGLSFASFYPQLWEAYDKPSLEIEKELLALRSGTAASAARAAARIGVLSAPLIAEINRIARDPIPPGVNDILVRFNSYIQSLERDLRALPQSIAGDLAVLIRRELEALSALGADQLALLFGLSPGQKITDLVKDAEARARLAETMLFEQLGEPVIGLLETLAQIESAVKGSVALPVGPLRRAAETVLHAEIDNLAGKLSDLGGGAHNLLREADVERLAVAVAAAAIDTLARLTGANDPKEALTRLERVADELKNGGAARDALIAAIKSEIVARLPWLEVVDPALEPAIRDAFRDTLLGALDRRVTADALREIRTVDQLVRAAIDGRVDELVGYALVSLGVALDAATALQNLAEVSRARDVISGWCASTANGALTLIKSFAHGVLAPQSNIHTAIARISGQIGGIVLPLTIPEPIRSRFEAIRARLLLAIAPLDGAAADLRAARQAIASASGADICTTTTNFADNFARAMNARAVAAARLRDVARELAALRQLVVESPNQDFEQIVGPPLDLARTALRTLVGGLTIVQKVDVPGVWRDIIDPAVARLDREIKVPTYRKALGDTYRELVAAAKAIQQQLPAAAEAKLVELVEDAVALADPERRIAGLFIETVALADEARDKIEANALALAKGAASLLLKAHNGAIDVLKRIDDAARYPAIRFLLTSSFPDLGKDIRAIQADTVLLDEIDRARTYRDAAIPLAKLSSSWKNGIPLAAAIDHLADFIDEIVRGRFFPLLGQAIRDELKKLERSIRDAIAQFVPTAIKTRFDWMSPMKPAGSTPIHFEMKDGATSDDDLTIATLIDFDFVSGRRNVSVTGKMKPFSIEVTGLFTIEFAGASFTSLNGSSPDFKADIASIKPGAAMTFLQQLQAIIGPSGNGLYVVPSLTGIKVGFAFARDQVALGSLTFSNIALDVYADLKFGSDPTIFGFRFASAARPFLISSPPYGGGGWLSIITYGGKTDIELAFMFGAVTDIAFGPLKGQGRVCTGIHWSNKQITTFIEAVGEGSIACFSISIYIGFYLTHQFDGSLFGRAIFEYKFKVGFVTFKYRVEARRKIAGPGGGGQAAAPSKGLLAELEAAGDWLAGGIMTALPIPSLAGTGPSQVSEVPRKATQWRDYCAYQSLDLLND